MYHNCFYREINNINYKKVDEVEIIIVLISWHDWGYQMRKYIWNVENIIWQLINRYYSYPWDNGLDKLADERISH